MLLGLGYRPERSLPILDHLSDRNAAKAFASIRQKAERLSASLPSQYEYLTAVTHGAAATA
jgi:hypothetical protein